MEMEKNIYQVSGTKKWGERGSDRWEENICYNKFFLYFYFVFVFILFCILFYFIFVFYFCICYFV